MSLANPRGFRYFSAGTVAQPLVATTLSAAINPCAPTTTDGAGHAGQSVAVADSSIFVIGDVVNLVPATGNVTPPPEPNLIITAIPDATHIVLFNFAPHASGDWVVLSIQCTDVTIQSKDGNTGALFIGGSLLLTNLGVKSVYKIVQVAAAVQPNEFSLARTFAGAHSWNIADITIVAVSAGDQYLPGALV